MAKSKTEPGNAQMPGFSDTLQLTPKIEKPHYAGHRDRLKQRFRETPDALADYELLEMLLFRAIRRSDTKPLAKALLTRFGSIAEVLAAPEKLIAEVPGAGPTSRMNSSLWKPSPSEAPAARSWSAKFWAHGIR